MGPILEVASYLTLSSLCHSRMSKYVFIPRFRPLASLWLLSQYRLSNRSSSLWDNQAAKTLTVFTSKSASFVSIQMISVLSDQPTALSHQMKHMCKFRDKITFYVIFPSSCNKETPTKESGQRNKYKFVDFFETN